MRILPHLEAQVAGAIERIELHVQRRGPLQISGPLGGLGRLDVVPPFLVEGRRPQVIAGARVHLARPEGLVPLLVQPGRLGRLVLVFPDPPRVQIGSSALVGVGGGLPVRQLLVEMPRLDVVSPPDQAPCRATVRRAGAAVPEEAWNQPHDPEDEEAEDDGTGGGTGGKIADQTLPRGQPFPQGVGTRGGLLRRLGRCQDGNEYPAQQHRQQTEDRQGATADRGEGPSRGGPGYEATRCRGVHQSNPPVWGRRIQTVGRVGDNRSRRPGGAAGGEGRPTARRRTSPAAHEDHRSALARSSSSWQAMQSLANGNASSRRSPIISPHAFAQAVFLLADLVERLIHLLQHAALGIADGQQEFLRVGAAGLVGNVLDLVSGTLQALHVRAADPAEQFLPLGQQALPELLDLGSLERHSHSLPWTNGPRMRCA